MVPPRPVLGERSWVSPGLLRARHRAYRLRHSYTSLPPPTHSTPCRPQILGRARLHRIGHPAHLAAPRAVIAPTTAGAGPKKPQRGRVLLGTVSSSIADAQTGHLGALHAPAEEQSSAQEGWSAGEVTVLGVRLCTHARCCNACSRSWGRLPRREGPLPGRAQQDGDLAEKIRRVLERGRYSSYGTATHTPASR